MFLRAVVMVISRQPTGTTSRSCHVSSFAVILGYMDGLRCVLFSGGRWFFNRDQVISEFPLQVVLSIVT